jgi:hypothetical protein
MTPLLLTVAMTLGADEKATPNIEGKWLIVYAEEGSRRNTTWEQKVATAKGDSLSYSKEGEDRALKLTFGAGQTVKAELSIGGKVTDEGKSLGGVYIAGQDYLCLSLNPGGAAAKESKADSAKSSGALILILRRQR